MSDAVTQSVLTVLAPVRAGRLDRLRGAVGCVRSGPDSPFACVASTHFARFVILPSLLDGDGEPVGQSPYLLFTADFDGSTESWLEQIAQESGRELDAVLEHCDGYPGSADPAAFSTYLHRHDVGAGFSVISYAATVAQIRRSLTRQRWLRALAGRAGTLSASELQAEWGRRFAG